MLTELHHHMVSETQQSAKTDTVFILTGVVFNLVVLAINWGIASPDPKLGHTHSHDVILGALVIATLAVNVLLLRGLAVGRDRMNRLLTGLTSIYADAGVGKYYDPSLREGYRSRYSAFIGVIGILAAMAVLVPLLARLTS